MSKGDDTRQRVLRQTSGLFNTKGYYGTSLSEIMEATGLQKGGLYNHFPSKEALALEVFHYNIRLISNRFDDAERSRSTNPARLKALFAVTLDIVRGDLVPGGCPMLNAGVESDDCFPPLRDAARGSLQGLRIRLRKILRQGLKAGEFKSGIDAAGWADFFLASVEGGIFLAKLEGVDTPLRKVLNRLEDVVDNLC